MQRMPEPNANGMNRHRQFGGRVERPNDKKRRFRGAFVVLCAWIR